MKKVVCVLPLHVYGIWHKPDRRWIFGPCMATIFDSKKISENGNGLQKWKYYIHFTDLSTGFFKHSTIATEERYEDDRRSVLVKDATPPTKDWGRRTIPWNDCEWIDLGHIRDFKMDTYRFYDGRDACMVSEHPSWWK